MSAGESPESPDIRATILTTTVVPAVTTDTTLETAVTVPAATTDTTLETAAVQVADVAETA